MGKLFDIVGYKVVIHNDALGIPCFKKLWDSSKDKSFATNAISYIVLKNHPNSPYVGSMEESKRDSILRRELFDDKWVPNEDVLYAEKMYLEFNDTLSLKMLRSFRKKLESITTFLDEPTEHMDMKMVKEILSSAAIVDKTIKGLTSLEKQVKKEELESSTVRGGSELGHYELPKGR